MAPLSLFWILLVQICTTLTYRCNGFDLSKFPAILIFGDSGVDTGNNNYINTIFKGDFSPYGINFPDHIPTGRFSDGKLIPDMLVSIQGCKNAVPPFLQPNLSDYELRTGVCFASAGAGLDNQTTSFSNAIPMLKQPEYFRKYLQRLKRIVGVEEAQKIVREALVLINAGGVDLIYNFYLVHSKRILEFTVSEYQDFLLNNLQILLKELYDLGCRKMIVSGLPPIGCMPIIITANSPLLRTCVANINSDVQIYNEKLEKLLPQVQARLPGSKLLYSDAYNPLMDMIKNPKIYGFEETARGCCGTGVIEVGQFCNPLTPLCSDPSKYVFWDSIHPSQSAYRYLTENLLRNLVQI